MAEQNGGRMTVSMLAASLTLIGAIVAGFAFLDSRYDQSDDVVNLTKQMRAIAANEAKSLKSLHDDVKVALDRIIAQNYQIQVHNLNERISYYRDKADSAKLKPYERRELRRLQAEENDFKKKWPNIAANFGLLNDQELVN